MSTRLPGRVLAAPALFAVLLFGACAVPVDPNASPLVAISNMKHPPFSSWNADGEAVGIEVELVAAAANGIGRVVTWQEHGFGELIARVHRGEADVAAATIGITPERAKLVAFTKPYFATSIVALVRVGTDAPKRLSDLAGKTVGADRATTAFPAANTLSNVVVTATVDAGSNWGEMLRDGRIDAMIIDATDRERIQEQAGVPILALREALAEERFALAVHRDRPELLRQLDAAIDRYLVER